MPSATPMRAQDIPWSRSSRTRSRSPASIFVADVDGIRSSSSSSHIKAHSGRRLGGYGLADGDERGNPHLGENTDFKHDRVGRSLAISDAAAKLIIEHKQHMRERFPDTALADLALLP